MLRQVQQCHHLVGLVAKTADIDPTQPQRLGGEQGVFAIRAVQRTPIRGCSV